MQAAPTVRGTSLAVLSKGGSAPYLARQGSTLLTPSVGLCATEEDMT